MGRGRAEVRREPGGRVGGGCEDPVADCLETGNQCVVAVCGGEVCGQPERGGGDAVGVAAGRRVQRGAVRRQRGDGGGAAAGEDAMQGKRSLR